MKEERRMEIIAVRNSRNGLKQNKQQKYGWNFTQINSKRKQNMMILKYTKRKKNINERLMKSGVTCLRQIYTAAWEKI